MELGCHVVYVKWYFCGRVGASSCVCAVYKVGGTGVGLVKVYLSIGRLTCYVRSWYSRELLGYNQDLIVNEPGLLDVELLHTGYRNVPQAFKDLVSIYPCVDSRRQRLLLPRAWHGSVLSRSNKIGGM